MTVLKEKIIRYETDGHTVKGMDAGELIRCKDCNKNNKLNCSMAYWDMETGEITWWNKPDEYCSRAERKDNG